ncbi:hypothetical protein EN904_18870 [Mesorhizobium sp. M7A.F.Ca.CA.001.07.2.1]|nr:hypothetical protein EN983_10430 [Mesorhizobium sp. M7A.F.Ca.CA.004.08.2.1]RUX83234.1 hypothetical protein EN982_28100 [Mesorhizobium sp. M7A.F.Ca.CA.004.08.1.1]RUY58456.1 hypothetical protein EN973_02585 [Mesorhizobium sp. M7A.F.Ca.CA.001.12.1.1]RUY84437.1 hypothetical protein EN964_24660 [Mesorhizobium sp. M7A.F.Ca.CA.001.10.2.1]RUZ97883.1 hypothetical protein EN944_00020 [Mesorhizobium sp. M7A.F.Ca.US.006.01.2.1]RVA20047.1 hypothetical protein EN939_01140 [Mesorhizobium sp. M7A.F.Ca.CA.0
MDSVTAFANLQRCKNARSAKLPISPLEGEMSGRTEGGAGPRLCSICDPAKKLTRPAPALPPLEQTGEC